MANVVHPIRIYSLSNYTINEKDPLSEPPRTNNNQFQLLKEDYAKIGMRRTLRAVMLVHNHGHPNILLLKENRPNNSFFKLPGGELEPGESDAHGMNRLMNKLFGRVPEPREWSIMDNVAQWWRPRFDNNQYPYLPVHCTKPVELTTVFLVKLEEKWDFFVPSNYKLMAVPLFTLYENKEEYGPIMSNLPSQLSKFTPDVILN
eukprot:m.21223 g.21223  ORF g.21223 m.21223 type:complete len:203 (-) comp7081_c0_seq1:38-646(-)